MNFTSVCYSVFSVVYEAAQVDSFERVLRETGPLFYETGKGLMKKTWLCLDICTCIYVGVTLGYKAPQVLISKSFVFKLRSVGSFSE